jgi:hypothetical protein
MLIVAGMMGAAGAEIWAVLSDAIGHLIGLAWP